jgi:hypothetical protein
MADYATVHFRTMMVYRDGKLVAEIPVDQFPQIIVGMAKALQERKPVDMAAPLE